MARPRTARACAGKVGLFKRGLSMTTSPYHCGPRGMPVWVRIVHARKAGRHVELTPYAGTPFLCDPEHPVFNVRDEQEVLFE